MGLEVYVSLRGNGMHGIAVATTETKAIEQVTELLTSQAESMVWRAREDGMATIKGETVRVFKVIANVSSTESFVETTAERRQREAVKAVNNDAYTR